MGVFAEHGQLRWDENQGMQYIVAWDVNGNQADLSGSIRYQLNNQNGYIAPKVALVKRAGGITITNDAGNGTATLRIEPNSNPKVDEKKKVSSNSAYYVALTQGYLSDNRMPDGDYVIADAYVTALVPPTKQKDSVDESTEFEDEFEIEFRLGAQAAYRNLEVCYFDVPNDKWRSAKDIDAAVAASLENQSVTVKTKRLGQYVVTSITPPPNGVTPRNAIADSTLNAIRDAGATIEAAGRAMQNSAQAVRGLAENIDGSIY